MTAPSETLKAHDEISHKSSFRVNRQNAFDGSFVLLNGEPWVRAFPDASTSLVIFPPPPEPDRGACYAASLAADDYLEDFRAALRDGDDLAARMALHTLVGLAKVVAGQLSDSSYECFRNTTSGTLQ